MLPRVASLNADFHSLPTVHINNVDGAAVVAYVNSAGTGATAKINQSSIVLNTPAPFTAGFSSRGPQLAGLGDLLKPDVIAPGQDILAAVAHTPAQGNLDFNLLSGTSMATPHVAGIAALLKQLHPTWSPMMIKSALMTTGTDVLDGPNNNPTVIFSQGAGHIKPNSAADPGLVYNNSFNNWLAFLCGTSDRPGVGDSTCTALQNAGFSLNSERFERSLAGNRGFGWYRNANPQSYKRDEYRWHLQRLGVWHEWCYSPRDSFLAHVGPG